MVQRVKDGSVGAAILAVGLLCWYVATLGVMVARHEEAFQALVRGGVLRVGPVAAAPAAPAAPTGNAP